MSNCNVRWGFCAALAVISATIADPLVEFASNAGCFGRGSFTVGGSPAALALARAFATAIRPGTTTALIIGADRAPDTD